MYFFAVFLWVTAHLLQKSSKLTRISLCTMSARWKLCAGHQVAQGIITGHHGQLLSHQSPLEWPCMCQRYLWDIAWGVHGHLYKIATAVKETWDIRGVCLGETRTRGTHEMQLCELNRGSIKTRGPMWRLCWKYTDIVIYWCHLVAAVSNTCCSKAELWRSCGLFVLTVTFFDRPLCQRIVQPFVLSIVIYNYAVIKPISTS